MPMSSRLLRPRAQDAFRPVVVQSAFSQVTAADGTWADIQLDRPLTTLGFTGYGNGGRIRFRATLRQDSLGRCEVSWPANITWQAGSSPSLQTTANGYDVVELLSLDGGLSWSGFVVQSVAGTAVNYLDTFDRPDSATLGTSSSGAAWTQRSGTFSIANGRVVSPASGGECIATIPSGLTSGSYSITATVYINETIFRHDFGIVARAVSGQTLLLVQIASGQSVVQIWRRLNGSWTSLGSGGGLYFEPGGIYRMRVSVTPSTVSVAHYDGGQLFSVTLSGSDQSTFASAYDVGIRANASAGGDIGNSKIDNLLVLPQ